VLYVYNFHNLKECIMTEYGMNVETNLNENFIIYGKKEKEKEMVININMKLSREKHRVQI